MVRANCRGNCWMRVTEARHEAAKPGVKSRGLEAAGKRKNQVSNWRRGKRQVKGLQKRQRVRRGMNGRRNAEEWLCCRHANHGGRTMRGWDVRLSEGKIIWRLITATKRNVAANRIRDRGGRRSKRAAWFAGAHELLIRDRWYISSRVAAADNPVRARRKGEVPYRKRRSGTHEGGEEYRLSIAWDCVELLYRLLSRGEPRETAKRNRDPIYREEEEDWKHCRHHERNKRPCLINA